MNYFAHGRHFVDQPYYLAGTAIPDWLNVVNRKVRVRSKHAKVFIDDADANRALIAQGVMQHHFDDDWFHQTRAFVELSWTFSDQLREILPEADGHRRGFVGHIIVEILLDAVLIQQEPQQLEDYYQALTKIDPQQIEDAVNVMAIHSTEHLAALIPQFIAVKFLWDYLDHDKLYQRLNSVMKRVALPALPTAFRDFLPLAQEAVAARQTELLTNPNSQ